MGSFCQVAGPINEFKLICSVLVLIFHLSILKCSIAALYKFGAEIIYKNFAEISRISSSTSFIIQSVDDTFEGLKGLDMHANLMIRLVFWLTLFCLCFIG